MAAEADAFVDGDGGGVFLVDGEGDGVDAELEKFGGEDGGEAAGPALAAPGGVGVDAADGGDAFRGGDEVGTGDGDELAVVIEGAVEDAPIEHGGEEELGALALGVAFGVEGLEGFEVRGGEAVDALAGGVGEFLGVEDHAPHGVKARDGVAAFEGGDGVGLDL